MVPKALLLRLVRTNRRRRGINIVHLGPEVAQRLKENLPDVKLIALLRNPMDRAFSNYWASRQNGLETLSFDEAIKREEERSRDPKMKHIMPFAYIARSR